MELFKRGLWWFLLLGFSTGMFAYEDEEMSRYSEEYLMSKIDFLKGNGVYLIGEQHLRGKKLKPFYEKIAKEGMAIVLKEGLVDDPEYIKFELDLVTPNYKGLEDTAYWRFMISYDLLAYFLCEESDKFNGFFCGGDKISMLYLYYSYYHDEEFKLLIDRLCEEKGIHNIFDVASFYRMIEVASSVLSEKGTDSERYPDSLSHALSLILFQLFWKEPKSKIASREFYSELMVALYDNLSGPVVLLNRKEEIYKNLKKLRSVAFNNEGFDPDLIALGVVSYNLASDAMLLRLNCRDVYFAKRIEKEYRMLEVTDSLMPIVVIIGAKHLKGVADLLNKSNIPYHLVSLEPRFDQSEHVHDDL